MKIPIPTAGILIMFIFCSCATKPATVDESLEMPPINGMIYDYDNVPVSAAVIRVNAEKKAVSDINGRFFLSGLEPSNFSISVEREGYEAKSVSLEYSNPNQILYIKIFSAEQLLSLAEKALEKRDWATTEMYLRRAGKIRPDDVSVRFIQAVLAFRKDDPRKSQEALESLIADGVNDPFVHLFLADIFQFKLNQPEKAIPHLNRFLDMRYDPDIEKRRTELKKSVE